MACGTGRRCASEIEITGTCEKVVEHRLMLGQVEPAVQGRDKRRRLSRQQRERVIVKVKVDDIKFAVRGGRPVRSYRYAARWDRALCRQAASARGQIEARFAEVIGIAAGEQRNIMAERDEFLGQPGDDALGAAIEASAARLRSTAQLERSSLSFSWSTAT